MKVYVVIQGQWDLGDVVISESKGVFTSREKADAFIWSRTDKEQRKVGVLGIEY